MKTRLMNAPPGTYNSLFDCFKDIVKVGPSGLFKGFIPAFIRLGTIAQYVLIARSLFDACFRSTYDSDVHLPRTVEEELRLHQIRQAVIDSFDFLFIAKYPPIVPL
jgi:hypothetical protein